MVESNENNNTYEVLSGDLSKRIQDECKDFMSPPEVRLASGCVITHEFTKSRERIQNFKVRPDDIWICTFPKCGTTWSQEMIWLLRNDINFTEAKEVPLYERTIFLEYKTLYPDTPANRKDIPDLIEVANTLPSPRIIKTHLPISELPKDIFTVKPKMIYVHRDPRDAAVSYYHHFCFWNNYEGTLDDFLTAFAEDLLIYSPYWRHVLGYYEKGKDLNIIINSFEEMKKDLRSVIKKTADFLGVTYTKQQEVDLVEHLSFSSMKDNPMTNFQSEYGEIGQKKNKEFMRKGKVGSYKEEMSDTLKLKFKEWIARNLKDSDFPFYRDFSFS